MQQETGLHLRNARLSGNPIAWTADGRAERLFMVHTRMQQHVYAHWLVRLDPHRNLVVAISRAPVLQSTSFKLGGHFPGVLFVGSFHRVITSNRQQVCSRPAVPFILVIVYRSTFAALP